jgi:PAS domain S-box-containing protein
MGKEKKNKNFFSAVKNIISKKSAAPARKASKPQQPARPAVCEYGPLFDAVPLPVYIRGRNGAVLYANAPAERMLGMGETPPGQTQTAFDGKSVQADTEADLKALKTSKPLIFEEQIYRNAGGARRFARVIKTPLKNAAGVKSGVLTFFEDITERKEKEDAMLRQKELCQSILDYTPMAIYTRDLQGRLYFCNKKTEEILGEEPSALQETHANQTEEQVQKYFEREARVIKEGRAAHFPHEHYKTKQGAALMLDMIKVPLPPSGAAAPSVLTIAQDITERYIKDQEILKTQNILQTLFNNAPVGIYARDEKGEILFRNKKSLYMIGGAKENATQTQKDRESFYAKRDRNVLKSGKTLDIAAEEFITQSGERRVMHLVKAPVYDNEGKPLMVITITEDVTDARRKELEILRSKNFLQEVIDNLPLALFAKKYDGRYILWNKKSAEVFGKEAAEVLGKTRYNDEITREQEEFLQAHDMRVFETRTELDIPQELISTAQGSVKIMHTVKTPLFYEDGSPNCLLGVSEDITAKTKTERAAYESRAKYSLLVENFPGGVLLTEQDKITFANKALADALGTRREELNGKTFDSLAAPSAVKAARSFYAAALAGAGAAGVLELAAKGAADGREFEASAAMAKYLGKKILIIFLRDITKERRMETNAREKDDKFRAVFEGSRTPFVILQHNGYIYDMNRAARDLFSFTREERPLYSSIYIKPGLSLAVRKAMENLESVSFNAVIDFARLNLTLPGINKSGSVELKINASPVNGREAKNGRALADYLLELTPPPAQGAEELENGCSAEGAEILLCQDPAFLCSAAAVVLKCSQAAQLLLGLSPDKILGEAFYGFFDRPEAVKADIAEFSAGAVMKDRGYNLKQGASLIPVEAAFAGARNNNFTVVLRNVAARRQLTELLKERSEKFEALSHVIDGALLECDINEAGLFSNFTEVNAKALTLTGMTHQELMSSSLTDALTDKEGKERKKVLLFLAGKAKQLKEDKVISFEARLQFKGKDVFASVRVSAYETAGRQKAMIVIRDTSKEKILESELDYKLKELAGIKEALPGLYLKVDKHGVIQEYKTADIRYNIAVFPSDFVSKNPLQYLDKATVETYLANIRDVIETGIPVHGGFSMKYGSETRFYEAAISPIKGEENVIVLVNSVDKRKGLENKIHDLYAISSNREAGFVKNMDDVLEFGKQIFNADAGVILHFSGYNREKILVNYATRNDYKIERGLETPVDECYEPVRAGQIFACSDTGMLECKDCLHLRKESTSMISAPLLIAGRVEGAITFLTVNPNQMIITEEDKNFIGFIGGLMGMALELRQAKKAVDSGLSTLKKLISSLDVPAMITDTSFNIKNANEIMLRLCGVYNIIELEDKNLFAKLALDSLKAESDFVSSYKTSRGGVFDISLELVLGDARPFSLMWHVVEVKDAKGRVRGFLLVGESIKEIAALRNLFGPASHI